MPGGREKDRQQARRQEKKKANGRKKNRERRKRKDEERAGWREGRTSRSTTEQMTDMVRPLRQNVTKNLLQFERLGENEEQRMKNEEWKISAATGKEWMEGEKKGKREGRKG